MNNSRQPAGPRRSQAASALGLAFLGFALATALSGEAPKPSGARKNLPPFLEDFNAPSEPPTATRNVRFPSAAGRVGGYLARPDTRERLAAVLLLHQETGLSDWMKQNARDLSGLGYVVLALNLSPGRARPSPRAVALAEEQMLARLSAAIRWLRRQADVLPDRIGVAGWGWGGRQALILAASTPLQACVVCDAPVTHAPAVVAGLRGTPVLGIFAGKDPAQLQTLPAFRKALDKARILHQLHLSEGVAAGFMEPLQTKVYAEQAADAAWIQIYEFLGKHVEDAGQNVPAQPPSRPLPPSKAVATIADLMRSVNGGTGTWGKLVESLQQRPATAVQWRQVRAGAALMAEMGSLLQARTPRKGRRSHWLEEARGYTAAAEAVATAADRQDYAAAQRGVQQLTARCAACHKLHR